MMYYIFTLKFLTPVHFGDTANGGSLDKFSLQCSADTLFAALCNEAANKGSDAVETLVKKTVEGKIVFSSLFPYCRTVDDDLYFYASNAFFDNYYTKIPTKKHPIMMPFVLIENFIHRFLNISFSTSRFYNIQNSTLTLADEE